MNRSHAGLSDWGLRQIRIEKHFAILDVGCGGGRTLQQLATMSTEGRLYGVDYAAGSIAAARRTNASLIQAGRVEIRQASVSALPFADDAFDLVTAVETQYYWPDLVHDMREILRVLKPGGTLLVVAEIYKGNQLDPIEGWVMRLLRATLLSMNEQQRLFLEAGYTEVQLFEEQQQGWFCGTGRKPA